MVRAPGDAATHERLIGRLMVSIIERLTPWRDVRASLRTRATADRVRYVGELVAMVVATDRYHAEDAADLVAVDYAPLGAVVDPVAALDADAPVLHPSLGSNLINVRRFRYGNPKAAFEVAPHRIGISVAYPRSACTPIETYGVIASYEPGEDTYDVTANFQGPFSIHAVVARSLNVPGNRLRLRTPPDPGGSFAIKQGVFPYMILAGIAARIAGAPVKWIEDRLEHLSASVSATNRQTRIEAAVTADGRIGPAGPVRARCPQNIFVVAAAILLNVWNEERH